MASGQSPGVAREALRTRYDISEITEDAWHRYTDEVTHRVLKRWLFRLQSNSSAIVLNAGSGIYRLPVEGCTEVAVDLFLKPLTKHPLAVCADVQQLPFQNHTFDAVICVGEVLAYCDPARAVAEFARVLKPNAFLVCDFGSTRGFRHLFKQSYGRTVALIKTEYNGTPEATWTYDPQYIVSLLKHFGLKISEVQGCHTLSAIARRLGLGTDLAIHLQRCFGDRPRGHMWGETVTIAAELPATA